MRDCFGAPVRNCCADFPAAEVMVSANTERCFLEAARESNRVAHALLAATKFFANLG